MNYLYRINDFGLSQVFECSSISEAWEKCAEMKNSDPSSGYYLSQSDDEHVEDV